jgi:AcrR family transcriptional regulator
MSYSPPIQSRSRTTERKLLAALDELLRVNGYTNTTIDEVAERAGLTRASFLKRFGSKEQAVILLFSKYCQQVSSMMESLQYHLSDYPSLHFTLREMSQQFEAVLQMHMSANRAMHEHFQQRLEVHDLTKQIFKQCVELMKAVQAQFLEEESYTDAGAWYASQLLVTIDYNYLLRAMPAFPEDHDARHNLLADLLEVTLNK